MTKSRTILAAAGLAAMLAATPAHAQLLNGTLDPDFAPWTLTNCQVFSGWGADNYHFGQTNCPGGIAQWVGTTAGESYTFTFDANNYTPGSGFLAVYFNNVNIFYEAITAYSPASYTTSAGVAAMVSAAQPPLGPGEAMLDVRGGRIWYKVSGTGKGTSMVLLHGGPGAGSFYLKPFEEIGDERLIIRYDQLGAGKSDRLTDTTLMVIPRFVEELDSLRRTLKIDKWIVNGQSWGTVLALEYYKAHPEHVAAIVFGGSVFDWPAYARETEKWTKTMSDSAQRAIAQWKKDGIDTTHAFKAATDEFYAKFVFRRPPKADMDSTTATFGAPQYTYMQGAYEYVVTGTMKNYDQTSFLPKIKVPVLSVTGEFDEVGPQTVEKHARMIPGAKFVNYKGAAHITSWDAHEANVKDVREFASGVDKR